MRPRFVSVRLATLGIIAAGAGVAACHDATAPAGPRASMRVLRQDAPTDTVLGAPAILVLQIFDGAGRPAAITPIDFHGAVLARGNNTQFDLYIAPDTARPTEQPAATRTLLTDGDGRIAVAVLRRVIAGRPAVTISSPAIGALHDSVVFVTTPGNAVAVQVFPSDSATTVGGAYALGGVAIDQWENQRADPVTFTIGAQQAVGPGTNANAPVATLDGQTLRGLQTGRVRVDATSGTASGRGWVSVIPMARLAAVDPALAGNELPALVLINTDGSAIKRYGLNRYSEGHPRWVPGTGRIILENVPVNGSDPAATPRLAYVDTATGAFTDAVPSATGINGEYRPAVDARTRSLYFAAVTPVPSMQPGVSIYSAAADGSGFTFVGPPVDPYTGVGEPDVSPDGASLAVRRNGLLMRMDLATGALTRLGARPEADDARWSPDGTRIAFREQGLYWIINADGSNERALAEPTLGGDVFPGHGGLDWSPDGGWIVLRANGSLQLLDPVSGLALPLPGTSRLVGAVWSR